jgi:hypothetical protein
MSSVALNQFLGSAISITPIVALSLPAIMLSIESVDRNGIGEFRAAWTALSTAMNGVPEDLKLNLIANAEENLLPSEFIDILRNN